ncbi:MAG: tetratricopeptide repeat protein [Myxococcales bacterium]|nr:tetratricopeptide repeat protein [Myxococcales bacterium]
MSKSRALLLAALVSLPVALPIVPAHAQETRLSALEAEAKAKPKDAGAAFALGRAYRRAGKWAAAKTELARGAALATGEEQVKLRYELALSEIDQGVVNTSLPKPPSLPACANVKIGKLGEALSRVCAAKAWLGMERISIAEDELTAAEKAEPGLYEVKLGRLEVTVAKQTHDAAIVEAKSLTNATPARAEAWLYLGTELLAAGKRADAVAPLKKARELDADWPEAAYHLARALPDGVEARDLARTAVAMRSAWPAAQVRLGELELGFGTPEAGQKAFEAALKGAPKLVAAHVGLAWSLVKQKKWDDAKKASSKAIELAANNASARLAHAEALAGGGDVENAVEEFKFAAGLDNKDPTGLLRASQVLLGAKEPMKALGHAEAAVKAFPEDGRTYEVRADAELATGDKKAAKDDYKKALTKPNVDKVAVQKKLDAIK